MHFAFAASIKIFKKRKFVDMHYILLNSFHEEKWKKHKLLGFSYKDAFKTRNFF